MSKELLNVKTGEIMEHGFSEEQIQLLKRTVAKDLSDDEFLVFLNVCKKVQLDPFSKQIYPVKYAGRMTIQTGIDGLRLVADRTGEYAPGKAPTFTYKDNKLESATSYIMKYVKGQWFEVSSVAFMDEYVNSVNQLWRKLPHVMLAKCSEANGLRRAFPNETDGLYASEEMDQANAKPEIKQPQEKKMQGGKIERTIVDEAHGVIEIPSDEITWPEPAVPKPIEEPKSSKFIGRLHQIAREKGLSPEKMKASLKLLYGVESSKDLTDDQCSALIKTIEKGGIKNG